LSALDLLQRNIVKYIYEQGWPSLRRIQEAAIQQAHDTSNNLILAAPTASGKTEAAFIPAINGITDWSSGVKIIYVSPLIALINDQFKRITELCEYMDVPVTSWHGESSRTRKKQLLKDPRGILLITPESLEAMLTRRPGEAQALFGDVEWVIVDELHSFLDTSRGVHVKSLLGRISRLAKKAPRYIGMTATLNRESYSLAKSFFISSRDSSVLLDGSRNELSTTIVYERSDGVGTPSGIIDNIYDYSCRESMLVFPNARGRVEEIAVGLKRRAKKSGNNVRYFAHHASVDKELRLEAEEFAKASKQQLFTICCTSTLELGIDIGAVDSVAQVEGPPSVASLAQRLGRSGRQKQHSILHLYASKEWSLLQGIATLELYKHGTIEEVAPIKKPYNVLVQQILSLLLQFSGMSRQDLLAQLHSLECWGEISSNEIEQVIDHLKDIDFIEDVDHVYVTGISAERTIESKDFYAHFEPKVEFQVLSNHEHIGEMPLSTAVTVGANVFLAARIWKIMDVDSYGKKIRVIPAEDGKAPIFGGGAGDVSHLVRREMLACLQDVDRTIQEALAKLANEN
jgi:ATP-dependent Lhr-like helicase